MIQPPTIIALMLFCVALGLLMLQVKDIIVRTLRERDTELAPPEYLENIALFRKGDSIYKIGTVDNYRDIKTYLIYIQTKRGFRRLKYSCQSFNLRYAYKYLSDRV